MLRSWIYWWRNDNLSRLAGGGRLNQVEAMHGDLNYKFNLWPHLKLFSEYSNWPLNDPNDHFASVKRPKVNHDNKPFQFNYFIWCSPIQAPSSPHHSTYLCAAIMTLTRRKENWWPFNQITSVHINTEQYTFFHPRY